jgi:hypothetical protein
MCGTWFALVVTEQRIGGIHSLLDIGQFVLLAPQRE